MNAARGVSLVELLVAAALTTLLTAAALTLVARGRAAHAASETRAGLEETASAALDLIAADVRLAGYLGLPPPTTAVTGATALAAPEAPGLEVGGGCVPSLAHDLATLVGGADGAYLGAPGIALSCRAGPSDRPVAGADTLVLRHAASEPTIADAGRLQVEGTRRGARLTADGTRQMGDRARLHDLVVHVYYVSRDSTATPGVPSLRRKRLVGGTRPAFQDEELLSGVTDLQVEAGIDSLADGDDVVDRYVRLDDVPREARIRALRLWVRVDSDGRGTAAAARPELRYANRHLPADTSRSRRMLASRTVHLRNAGASP